MQSALLSDEVTGITEKPRKKNETRTINPNRQTTCKDLFQVNYVRKNNQNQNYSNDDKFGKNGRSNFNGKCYGNSFRNYTNKFDSHSHNNYRNDRNFRNYRNYSNKNYSFDSGKIINHLNTPRCYHNGSNDYVSPDDNGRQKWMYSGVRRGLDNDRFNSIESVGRRMSRRNIDRGNSERRRHCSSRSDSDSSLERDVRRRSSRRKATSPNERKIPDCRHVKSDTEAN